MRLTIGAIFFDEEFIFHDGDSSPKLFIVLGDKDNAAVVVKTTSNGRLYRNDYGCQSTSRFPAFFLPQNCCCLKEHTWVCLGEFYEFAANEIMNNMVFRKIRRIGELPPALVREVMDCAVECEDITPLQESIIKHSMS